ncbi:MAG: glycerol-3-phosphate dehydrogenase C-terminal domain-containing protein, partial [Microbacterium sp.]
ADVSRRHLVSASESGFVTVLGGKLTTYRRMAEDAVDLASESRGLQAAPSRTPSLRLVERVVPPSDDLLDDATGLTRAEVEFAVREEGAMNADDVLDRRTRVGLVDDDRERCREAVEEVVARTLAGLV